jgi:hypothetical protein
MGIRSTGQVAQGRIPRRNQESGRAASEAGGDRDLAGNEYVPDQAKKVAAVPHAIALLPWIHCREMLTVGPLRILPYAYGQLPGKLANADQADIDSIFGAYAIRPKVFVKQASIFELAGWQTGMDVEAADKSALFRARDALAFAALAKRQLFHGHFNYTNSDAYSLVIQRYLPGSAGSFSFSTRRRDTGTSHLWSSTEFAFHRPHHVSNWNIEIDEKVLAAALELELESPLREAMREFNQANTDSSDIPEHVEMVMVKSALEWLFGIGTGVEKLVAALRDHVESVLHDPPSPGPLSDRWVERWPKAKRPLEAWARDFCDVRGSAAHGADKAASRFVWPARTHLAFASIIFPLLFKKRLADEGRTSLDVADAELLGAIEELLLIDPLSSDALSRMDDNSHPWSEFQFSSRFLARGRRWRTQDDPDKSTP